MTYSKFSKRCTQDEQMDDLSVSGSLVDQTLRELDQVNKWLGGNRITLSGLQYLISPSYSTELHVADLGCGSGTMLRLMADWGRSQNIKLKLTGVDANPYIVDYAKSKSLSYPEIDFQVVDIMDKSFAAQKFDIITSTLFTHHFSDGRLQDLINSWRHQARLGIVINDLHRHWLAYYSIKAITGWISKSVMVKNDAPVSVLRGFQRKDWEKLMEHCEISRYELKWRWAFRWLLVIPAG